MEILGFKTSNTVLPLRLKIISGPMVNHNCQLLSQVYNIHTPRRIAWLSMLRWSDVLPIESESTVRRSFLSY